jgi:murein DD-endopeptidase MepM/ murein hydrolase activator NlpD
LIKAIPPALLSALLASPALAALPTAAWVISPADGACRTDLELAGRSGAVSPVQLISDGQRLVLRFARENLPEQAFLAVRIDQKRFSNLMTRTSDPAVGELTLSPETEAALRKGSTLDVAWLAAEPVGGSLAGSEQGVSDLRACGLQAAARAQAARETAAAEARRTEEEAHRRAVAEAELQAARAQAGAAEAERQRLADEAAARQAEQDARRQQAAYDAQREAYERQAIEEAARRRAWEAEQADIYRPAPPPWAYRRY